MNSNAALLLYAGLAVAGLVFLIVRLKVSAFVALIIASIFVGLAAGMSPARVMKAFSDGVGGVLGSIAMILGLGTILGKMLAESGGAEAVANRLISIFGTKHLPWTFALIALVVGLPVFFGVGLVILAPILYATAQQHRIPLLRLGLPMVAGLSAAHGFIPPHPGPIAAIELLGANLGRTILLSLPVALISAAAAGPLFVKFFREHQLTVPGDLPVQSGTNTNRKLCYAPSLCVILLPIVLMTGTSLADVILTKGSTVHSVLALLGHPVVALLIGVVFAWLTIARSFGREAILKLSEESIGPIAVIILVIGAGAGFSRVLIESGVGKAVADIATQWNLPVLPMAFVLASLIRVATGSSTVAITTCAGLMKPIADALPGTNLELLVLAMGAGSLILSHVNDGGFWLVKGYLNLSVPQALRTWTVLETIIAIVGFSCVLLLDAFF
ncbi:MAG TPA: gluconate:H+ symporter [Verrucomicrobiae bacterium]